MKTTRVIIFCVLFACEMSSIRSREHQRNDSGSFTRSFSKLRPKTSKSKVSYQSDDSPPESGTDQDSSNDTAANNELTRKTSKREESVQNEPNFLQKISVPVGGPYCYTKTLAADLDSDVISRRKIRLMYSPQQSDQSLEMHGSETPGGTIEGEWPYEVNQGRKMKEVRKYIKLNVSLDRQLENYRLTSKAAERAFISRLYGFINPSERKITDDLIRFIDDKEKEADHLALDLGSDPLANFNSWDDDEKIKFCVKYINNSIVIFYQGIDFDPDGDEIIRKKATVRYKNSFLRTFEDTVHVVICPCVKISKDTDDIPLELGVLPIFYKYKQDFPYAFIYDILENENEEEDKIEVNVKALTKIDVDGLAADRKTRDRQQQKKREQKEKEKRKARQEPDADENGEGTVQKVLHKIFSL